MGISNHVYGERVLTPTGFVSAECITLEGGWQIAQL